jgi:hypothetical protein
MGTKKTPVRTKSKYFCVMKLTTTEFILMITKNMTIKHLAILPLFTKSKTIIILT